MPKFNILNVSGELVGEIELNDAIFGIEPNTSVMHDAVKNYLANQRQGTQSAKTRAEVRGGGKKPFKQKGTGRARQGTIRAPHFVGGGVAFAPKSRDYSYKLPKKVKRLAMLSALSSKAIANNVIVLDDLALEMPKTKDMIKILKNVKADSKTMIIMGEKNMNVVKSAKNIPGVKTALTNTMNVYDILNHQYLVLTKDAVEKIEEVYA